MELSATDIIEGLGMRPHPEGGWYVETWRADPGPDGRSTSTAIYFLLEAHQRSHWHRVDADEVFCHHAGAPLRMFLSSDGSAVEDQVLGSDIAAGHQPHLVVPRGQWQAAVSEGSWTLVSCVVAPGFTFEGFELAPEGWAPGPPR